jgi:outer membrane lipoprotein-sorting protein
MINLTAISRDFKWPTQFEANYEQIYEKTTTQQKKITKGKIFYQIPFRLKLIVEEPLEDQMTYYSSGEENWKYLPSFDGKEKGQVIYRKSSPHSILHIFEKLQKNEQGGKGYRVEKKHALMVVHLEKNTLSDMKVSRIEFVFKNPSFEDFSFLEKILFYEGKKLVSTLYLNQISLVSPLSEGDFKWTSRDDVVLIQQ